MKRDCIKIIKKDGTVEYYCSQECFRLNVDPRKTKKGNECWCGCGRTAKKGNRYIKGHYKFAKGEEATYQDWKKINMGGF